MERTWAALLSPPIDEEQAAYAIKLATCKIVQGRFWFYRGALLGGSGRQCNDASMRDPHSHRRALRVKRPPGESLVESL